MSQASTATETPSPAGTAAELRAPAKRSGVEGIKESSRQLRGTIALELLNDTDHFSEPDKQLLKFHGTYQQEDRDARKNRKKDGVGKHHMFMVRCKIPGGRIAADQYLALDELAARCGNSTLRFTSRQGIQFHGVLKGQLHETIAGINACLLSTLGACGDVERNVMACPAPHHHDAAHGELQETARVLAAHLAPRTRAYHEIWLNGLPVSPTLAPGGRGQGEGVETSPHDIEPLYGQVYLPRKFKTGLALADDNCIDIYAQDLGLLALVEDGHIAGYNVLVGGGMGMTHGNAATFAHVGRPIGWVPAASVVLAAEAVVRLFRDHGNRADRKRARIKYLVHDWGVDKFREVLAGYLGGTPLIPPKPVDVSGFELHLGWHAQGDGKWYYGLSVENGRVKDDGSLQLRSGIRAIVERLHPAIRLTPMQDILFCDLEEEARPELEAMLRKHGIRPSEAVSQIRRHSMACPAIPTCGLALSESERALPGIIDELEAELKRLELADEKIGVRMTGCPNGCVRPYQSDIGLVGRSGDKYTLYVGGHLLGHRLNFPLRDLVRRADIVPTLVPILEQFKAERQPGETFGDFCQRQGAEKLQALLPAADHARHQPEVRPEPPPTNGEAKPKSAARIEPVPQPTPAPAPPTAAAETFFAGPAGEELRDFAYRCNSDGSVRDTVVYFYGADLRATAAGPGDALRREAVYQGRVDPHRLYAARKLSDTHYVGDPGHERRDVRIDFLPDGSAARTIVFHYGGDVRAAEAPSGSPLRRQAVYPGRLA